jgi:hypothetical protein
MRAKTLLLACLLFGGLPASALSQSRPVRITLPVPSVWVSQSGRLAIHSVTNGVLSGIFASNNPACGTAPIVGKITPPSKITFAVNFPGCNTIMAWRGQYSDIAIATGLYSTAIQPDGTLMTGTVGGNLFSHTR